MKKIVWVLLLATGLWVGCGKTQGDPEVVVAPQEVREVLTEHRSQKEDVATKQVGDDCTEHGASACLSGVCLHVKPGRNEGYVCSRPCQSEQECPGNWRCAQVHPASEGRLCIPRVKEA